MIESHLRTYYDFRFNLVSGKLEFKKKPQLSYVSLTDYNFNSIIRELGKKGIKVNSTTLRTVVHSDFTPKFDPFVDYFKSLPTWDGVDYIQQLADTVKTTNKEFWEKCLEKWLVAVAGCATTDSVINHTAIVFTGKQGSGKTTWMKNLLPSELSGYFYSGVPNLRNKDTKIRLSECLLINLDEMDNLSRKDTDRLKEIITSLEIRERRPYAQFDDTMPRRASFMGSVNSKQYLNDPTGNRRFLTIEVEEIQHSHSVDMNKVYSQAWHLFKTGFKYYFDGEEIDEILQHNEQFQVTSFIEETMLKWLEPVDPEQASAQHKWTATEIANFLATKTSLIVNEATVQAIGRYMKKYGFVRGKAQGVYIYYLNEKKTVSLIIT
ncbi:virulence-associated E family protein [Chitinophaga sedimenti]|uniref:VapE domain-containing protein n=1 Tax=Chitinophaga sedimenti TaxID=2033606 RepID=UPI002005BDE6|nr:VapE domain-containing protein [Chitinophaga sedimenti]MCK7559078.1 virulence-associated E family protein [Chitinophaga sedimenti]